MLLRRPSEGSATGPRVRRRRPLALAAAAVAVAIAAALGAVAVLDLREDEPEPRAVAGLVEAVETSRAAVAAAAVRDFEAAVAGLHDELVQRCWVPAAGTDGSSAVTVDADLTILADGTVGAVGVSERLDALRPGVASCVQDVLARVVVSQPDRSVQVRLAITLP